MRRTLTRKNRPLTDAVHVKWTDGSTGGPTRQDNGPKEKKEEGRK